MTESYGQHLVHVGDASAVPETGGFGSRSVPLREFAEACSASEPTSGTRETVFDRQEFVRQAGDKLAAEITPRVGYFEHWPQAGRGCTPYFSFGGEGVGLPFHEHSAAYNVVLFGRKRWFLYPPFKQLDRVESWAGGSGAPGEVGGTASPGSWSDRASFWKKRWIKELFNATFISNEMPSDWAKTVYNEYVHEHFPP